MAETTTEESIGSGIRRTKITVLIVESSRFINERLDQLLGEILGVEVVGHAKDENEALTLIEELNPEIIILDSSLPRAGSLVLLRRLKISEHHPLPIVIASNSTLPYRMKFHEEGAVYFFDKTMDLDRLVDALTSLMKERAS